MKTFIQLMSGAVLAVASLASVAADSITVRLKWFHQAQFAGFYVAQEKGF